MVPRLSSIGRQAARQASAAFSTAASSSFEPTSALPAGSTSSAVGATAPRPTRAAVQTPSFSVRLTPRPTTAMSISVRGIMRKYASLEPGGRGGSEKLTRISPDFRLVRPGPAGHRAAVGCAGAGAAAPRAGGQSAGPVGPLEGDDAPCRDNRGPAAAGRGAVAEIAAGGRPALHLLGADQVHRLEHAGPCFAEFGMFCERGAGHGRANAEATVRGLLDLHDLVDLLDIVDQSRPHQAG